MVCSALTEHIALRICSGNIPSSANCTMHSSGSCSTLLEAQERLWHIMWHRGASGCLLCASFDIFVHHITSLLVLQHWRACKSSQVLLMSWLDLLDALIGIQTSSRHGASVEQLVDHARAEQPAE